MSKIPVEDRPIPLDPDLAVAVEKILKPYTGEKLVRAQDAVQSVRRSGFSGAFGDIVERYRAAVKEAVDA